MTTVLNVGLETRVNTFTSGGQGQPQIASLADGGYIIVWESDGQDGSGKGIYGQLYDAHGHKLGSESHISATSINSQYNPSVTGLADGGFYVAWTSTQEGPTDQYGQRFDAAGNPVGLEMHNGNGILANVIGLSDGGYLLSYMGSDSSGSGVSAQRFDANGVATTLVFTVNTFEGGTQYYSIAAALNDGGFIMTWQSTGQDGDGSGVYAQRYSADGNTVGGEFLVETTTAGFQGSISATGLADGGYVIVWQSAPVGIVSQRYDADGNPVGVETRINALSSPFEFHPAVTALSDGGYVVAWSSFGLDGDVYGVYARHYDSDNHPVGDQFLVNTRTAGNQDLTSVAALADGGFVITWESDGQDGSGEGIYQKVYAGATSLVGSQTLFGTSDSDMLDGGGGGDKLYGGFGDDIYVVHSLNDVVNEYIGQGTDEVQSYVTYTLGNEVENLTLMGTSAITGNGNVGDNILTGNAGNNYLIGNGGNDRFYGGTGNDYMVSSGGNAYMEGGSGSDTMVATAAGSNYMYGGDGFDSLNGGTYTDYLDGGSGSDAMNGGAGDDQMYGGEGDDSMSGGFGNDTLYGGAGSDFLDGSDGNDLVYGGDGNDLIEAGTGSDHVYGDAGTDTYDASGWEVALVVNLNNGRATQGLGNVTYLDSIDNIIGSEVNDTITGNAANNDLNGGAGADAMSGSLGDDIYHVDNAGDVVTESSNATLGGYDLVITSVNFTLGSYIEDLALNGDGLTGNGNSLDNIITGDGGNNLIDGKAGNDTMIGGGGSDTYWVDSTGDVVVEQAAAGTDIVRAGLSYALGLNIENLVLTGTGDFSGTGNFLDNAITGNSGNNVIDGGAGADTMTGGTGNDTYTVDNAGDNVVEADNAGTDVINSSVTYTLSGRFIETLQLTGGANINATGNSKANILGSNTGNNSLTGGGGADTFLFQTGSAADTITDFTSSQGDTIDATAYHDVAHIVTLSGTSVIIDFGGGNRVTVLHATVADVTAHTVF